MKTILTGCCLLVQLICLDMPLVAQENAKYVNLFIGTSGDNGQVDPAACVPYGMVRICPDSKPRSHSGYDYAETAITGFSINRLSGIGCGGNGGNLSIQPALTGEVLVLDKPTEMASPGYYAVALTNGVTTECTATHNVGLERYRYPKGTQANMSLNVASSFTTVRDAVFEAVSDREVKGYVQAGTTCDAGTYKLYFNLVTDKPFKTVSATTKTFDCTFGTADGEPVEVRIALSPVSMETAAMENRKIKDLSFQAVKRLAEKQWNDLLDRIEVRGGTEADKTLFFTSLYRVFLSPFNATSGDGKFLATDGKIKPAEGFTYYSSWSMWDSYRTKFPLITLLDHQRMEDIAGSLTQLYLYGKKGWATSFECVPTVRTEHTSSVLLDCYRKGIKAQNLAEAYEGMKSEVRGLAVNRPDQAMETCIDYWAFSNIAKALNRQEDAREYENKALELFKTTWNTAFKHIDSTFTKMKNNGLYQGTRWQYRWAVPQFLPLMAESIGGMDSLSAQLSVYFDSSYNNPGNEVGLHAPFLFNALGHPEQTQKTVRAMLTQPLKQRYGGNAEYNTPITSRIYRNDPRGFLPEMDEDDGTMGAWYVFASLGIFPLVVGEPWYQLSSPLFNRVTIHFDNGKTLTMKTVHRQSPGDIIKAVKFNNREVKDFRIDHNALLQGGTLLFVYGS